MNEETIIKVMEFMQDVCESNETCKNCMFRINDRNVSCGLTVIPSKWNLNKPRDWKAFKE